MVSMNFRKMSYDRLFGLSITATKTVRALAEKELSRRDGVNLAREQGKSGKVSRTPRAAQAPAPETFYVSFQDQLQVMIARTTENLIQAFQAALVSAVVS